MLSRIMGSAATREEYAVVTDVCCQMPRGRFEVTCSRSSDNSDIPSTIPYTCCSPYQPPTGVRIIDVKSEHSVLTIDNATKESFNSVSEDLHRTEFKRDRNIMNISIMSINTWIQDPFNRMIYPMVVCEMSMVEFDVLSYAAKLLYELH